MSHLLYEPFGIEYNINGITLLTCTWTCVYDARHELLAPWPLQSPSGIDLQTAPLDYPADLTYLKQ